MDSLAVSAIGLAAGGWDKVKLTGIYTSKSNAIPAWKLGLCSTLSILLNNRDGDQQVCGVGQNTVLVAPGSTIYGYWGSGSGGLSFKSTSIANSSGGNDWKLEFTAVLFTW